MSYSLNSGAYIGTNIGDIKGDTRSLDSSSYDAPPYRIPCKARSILRIVSSVRLPASILRERQSAAGRFAGIAVAYLPGYRPP